jgi:UDP-N-acetylglucosamine 2-epimerase (non-hydrolysing)
VLSKSIQIERNPGGRGVEVSKAVGPLSGARMVCQGENGYLWARAPNDWPAHIMSKLITVCGTRPNLVKVAALTRAYAECPSIEHVVVHTGQHYDPEMSESLFRDLAMRAPDVMLGVGSGSHAVQTGEIMRGFEPVLLAERPDWVVVVGDVNSTLACALVAAKLHVRVAHVEAGLRCFDRSMPEEINRVLTDQISDLLFVSEASGVENLRREGIAGPQVHLVGSVMVDTLLQHRDRARQSRVLEDHALRAGEYATVTLHRPGNVDDPAALHGIIHALLEIAADTPVVFPAHPRTMKQLRETGLMAGIWAEPRLKLLDPLGYLDFLQLIANARAVLTDSGGVQEETTMLGIPCLTLRRATERPVTVNGGTNRLVVPEPAAILSAWHELERQPRRGTLSPPPFWDGHAAKRIVNVLAEGA